MKIRDLIKALDLKVLAGESGLDADVLGAYCCDLLSWVIAHANKKDAWITVQIHPNIVAVAVLLELSCIIIPEDIDVEEITIEKAINEGVPLFQSSENSYNICAKLKELGI